MRRFLILSLVMLCLLIAPVNVYAREESLYDDLGIEDIYDSLSKDSKDGYGRRQSRRGNTQQREL